MRLREMDLVEQQQRLEDIESLTQLGRTQNEAAWLLRAQVEAMRGRKIGWLTIAEILDMNPRTLQRQYETGGPIVAVRHYEVAKV